MASSSRDRLNDDQDMFNPAKAKRQPPIQDSATDKFSRWMVNEGPKIIFISVWIIVQATLFVLTYLLYRSPKYTNIYGLLGEGLPIARSSARVLTLNCMLILVVVCRNLISLLRASALNRLVPLDKNITFHKTVGVAIVVFTLIHTFAHFNNFRRLWSGTGTGSSPAQLAWGSGE